MRVVISNPTLRLLYLMGSSVVIAGVRKNLPRRPRLTLGGALAVNRRRWGEFKIALSFRAYF